MGLCSLFAFRPEVTQPWGLYGHGRVNGDLQEYLSQGAASRTAADSAPIPAVSPCEPTPPQETLDHQQVGLLQSPAPFPWILVHINFVCALQELSLYFPQSCRSHVIKSCWPSRTSQTLCWIPRLGSLTWGSDPS